MSKRVRIVLTVVALSALWFGVRVSNADSTMTTDETLWSGRSANFYLAIVKGEYQHTYQMAHPGVPVMLAGGLGVLATCPEYIHQDGFYVRDLAQSSQSFREIGCDPHTVFVAERLAKVAVQAIMIALSLILLSTLMPLQGLVFSGLMLAFSPWQAGLDQLLHVDGMFATASILTLSATGAMTRWSMRHGHSSLRKEVAGWFGVGVALALAVLTRSAAVVFLVPIGLGILTAATGASLAAHQRVVSTETVTRVIRSGAMVIIGCVISVVALFPAIWVAPRDVAERLLGFTDTAITEGHELVLYYNGEVVEGDPGPLFYWDALVWRSTPSEWVVLVGVLIVAISVVIFKLHNTEKGKYDRSSFWIVILLSLTFVLLYATGITLAAKKFERYFVLVSPFIGVMGGMALSEIWAVAKRPSVRVIWVVLVAILLVLQVVSLSGARPYMLDYFNPVVGGHEAAKTKFQLGWGHGGDQLTHWLVEKHKGEPVRVRSSTTIGVFSVFVPLDSQVHFERGILDSVSAWYHTDYYVSGFQQNQRGIDRSYHLLLDQVPVHTVQVGDITYFETFRVSSQPVPDALWQNTDCRHIAANGVQLMDVERRGSDVLVILRIDNQDLAGSAWVSIDESQHERQPVKPTKEGMLVGVVFQDSSGEDTNKVTIGGDVEALIFDFPFGSCTP